MKYLLALLLICTSVSGLARDTGLGIMLGYPTGVTAKKWVKPGQAIDAGAAWAVGSNSHFLLFSDYLWNKEDALFFQDTKPLDLYYGLGGRMKFDDEISLGVRVPVGLSAYFNDRRGETYAEIAPIVDLLPKTELEIHAVLGLRFYF